MEPTQISKSETFALNFATMVQIYNALAEVKDQPKEIKAQVQQLVLEAMVNHPNPAEA